MDSGGVPGRMFSLLEVSCKIRYNVGARTRARKREDNLSRPRPMEFLLSASRNWYLRFRDSSLSLPISYFRDKSCFGIVTILSRITCSCICTRYQIWRYPKRLENMYVQDKIISIHCYIWKLLISQRDNIGYEMV